MKSSAKRNILSVKPYVPGKPIEELKRELGLREVVKLASNENPYRPSPRVIKAITNSALRINRYPDGGCFYLRRELAGRLNILPEQLIFGNGSDEVIVLAVRTFVNPGDEVIIAKPSFLIYEIAAQIEQATIKQIPLKGFRYDLEAMKKAITQRTKIIFIGNPDNPAGTYVSQKEVENFLKGLRSNILVFFDEAYYEFARGGDYPETLVLMRKYKNILTTRTFSKMYGLAGLRIGYGVADPTVIDLLNRIRDPFNVNSMAQAAAVACLKDARYYDQLLKEIKGEKEFLYNQFSQMGLNFYRSATNFILLDLPGDGKQVYQALLKRGIIVRDMAFWGLENFIRVTVGTRKENQKLLKALGEIL